MQINHENGIQDDERESAGEFLFRFLPYWPLFLILLVLSIAGGWLYLKYATPIYETSATILVKDEKKGVDDANLMEQLDLFGSKKLVENEIEVIKSRMLMREVVRNYNLYAPIEVKPGIKYVSGYVLSPVIVQVQNPDSLAPESEISFTYDKARQEVVIGSRHLPLNQWVRDSLNTIRIIANPNCPDTAAEANYPMYYSLLPVSEVADRLQNGMKVSQTAKLASVINLKVRDAVPKRGQDILNGLIAVYNKAAVGDKNALAANTLKFINERLRIVAGELDSVESGIERYKTTQGIVDVSAQGQLYLDNVGVNDQKLSEINVQLAVMDEVEKYVQSKTNQSGIAPASFGVTDPILAQLLGKLSELEIRYEGLKRTTAENNPILVSLRDEIERIKPGILENIRNQRLNLEAGKRNLTGTSNTYASILRRLPKKEKGLVEISRQQSIKNGIYSFLLQKREETALSYNSAVADTRIVDTADSGFQPVSPKPLFVYIIAIMVAFGAGAGLIALKELLSSNIVFRKEIEHYSALPIIGELMQEHSTSPIVIADGQRTIIAEQFRQLRTSLAYLGVNSRKKKMLVTSFIGGEGKTFVSANLAISLALTNKKVVVLEMDLRKPKLSPIFGVSREVGLTNYFVGDKEADHIIKSTQVSPNLFVIPCGAIPPNPSELILNGRLDELLKYLESIFDYIIIDCAPTGPVTDAYILSPMCDATLYVIRHGVTPKAAVKMLDKNVLVRGLKNVAIIFNGVKTRGVATFGYGYGYNYTGSYGLEKSEKTKKKKEKNVN